MVSSKIALLSLCWRIFHFPAGRAALRLTWELASAWRRRAVLSSLHSEALLASASCRSLAAVAELGPAQAAWSGKEGCSPAPKLSLCCSRRSMRTPRLASVSWSAAGRLRNLLLSLAEAPDSRSVVCTQLFSAVLVLLWSESFGRPHVAHEE